MIEYIDVKSIAQEYRNRIREIVSQKVNEGVHYSLYVISRGNDERSAAYMKGKKKDCEEVGIHYYHYSVEDFNEAAQLINLIQKTGSSNAGIIIQSPSFSPEEEARLFDMIDYPVDVDRMSCIAGGRLFRGDTPAEYPATALGVKILLGELGMADLSGKNATVVGRGRFAGAPTAKLLQDLGATVTVTHRQTSADALEEAVHYADIVVLAAGHKGLVKSSWIGKDALVIDLGINVDEDGKLCGDLENDEPMDELPEEGTEKTPVKPRFRATPVPGGMGLMTRVGLLANVIRATVEY